MKLGRGQILILVILGLLLFGNLPRVLRETATSLRTRSTRRGRSTEAREDKTPEKEKGPKEGH